MDKVRNENIDRSNGPEEVSYRIHRPETTSLVRLCPTYGRRPITPKNAGRQEKDLGGRGRK